MTEHFDHSSSEKTWSQLWGSNALTDARNRFGFLLSNHQPRNWFLPMPPPNITGRLHLGHSLFLTLQDIQARYRALRGDNTLWLPGTDHAGLATHEKIIGKLDELGLSSSDRSMYHRIGWKWKDDHHHLITNQMKRMGAGCDWSKERFTLDHQYQISARAAFKKIWDSGLIYFKNDQWWMSMENLAAPLIQALKNKTLSINPMRSHNRLLNFLENIEPWCISRQIGWGMNIPIKQQSDGSWMIDEGEQTPGQICSDTLDTWFLSSLWPLASLGWPSQSSDYKKHYPGQWMETGEDILFFWCARMWMMCYFLTGQWPFTHIFCHGMIRDRDGNKMSKSLGNGIDPIKIIEENGADALRWHLALRAHPAKDIKFDEEMMKKDGAWLNKIWQAARFMSQYGPPPETSSELPSDLLTIQQEMNNYWEYDRYPEACQRIQKAFRHEFCSIWLEENKKEIRAGNQEMIKEAWTRFYFLLRQLHPIIPFITSEIHHKLWK